eukprot:TRINITY_DN19547_c0_g1_i1.p1 TRINITY_DN19547_c0_g1~~TRINITY_DN19547_c0_g1_i1.p1  ORF type:complete len:426 (+),score=77.04 TRINITY_DN19547_c0_g1_i1:183-1460(+)
MITWADTRAAEYCKTANKYFSIRAVQSAAALAHIFTRSQRHKQAAALKFKTNQALIRLSYVLKYNEEVKKLAAEENLQFGTVDTWLLYNLTGGKVHATDYTAIGSTGLWDPFIMDVNAVGLQLLGIPRSVLPKVMDTSGIFGHAVPSVFGEGNVIEVPIASLCGDQQAAAFASCCFNMGDVHCTIGTGTFLCINTGNKSICTDSQFYPFIGWKIKDESVHISEGMSNSTGSTLEWAKRIGIVSSVEELETLALTVENSGGAYFVPTFNGMQQPYNDDTATGALLGIGAETSKAHIARAILESISFRIYDLLSAMRTDVNIPFGAIHVDGGVTNCDFILQLCADLSGVQVIRAHDVEMSARGACYFAGLAADMWTKGDLIRMTTPGKIFEPTSDDSKRSAQLNEYNNWKTRAVPRALKWKTEYSED